MNIELIEERNIKSVSSVLKDNSHVKKQSENFYTEKHSNMKSLVKDEKISIPSSYSGKVLWKKYLLKTDGYGYFKNSALSSLCECISDRFSIMSLGDVKNSNVSSLEFICFKEIFNNKVPKEDVKSQKKLDDSVFSGLSIYDAGKAIYQYGLTTKELFNEYHLLDFGVRLKDIKKLDDLDKVSVDKVEGPDRNYCFNKNIARRSFSIRGIINIENDIETIKCEIYKNGPVVAGFVVYSDFLNNFIADYDTIYEGPGDKAEPIGGHFVRIHGWGKDKDGKPYWVCCNNWGKWGNWGGYFKIYMNIKECMLEDNVVAPVIDLGEVNTFYDYNLLKNDGWVSQVKPYNKRNFYSYDSIKLIKENKLNGSLSYFMKAPEFYPIYNKFYANNVSKYKNQSRLKIYLNFFNYKIDYKNIFIFFLLGFITTILFLLIFKGKKIYLKN